LYSVVALVPSGDTTLVTRLLAAALFGDDRAGLRGDVTAALHGDAAVTC
jgi:hypothetical protein